MTQSALARLIHAADAPTDIAAEIRTSGGRVVWTLGWDLPREIVDACGLHPIRLVPAEAESAALETIIGAETLSPRGRGLLAAIAALPHQDALLISHADAEQPQLFATLRELSRCGAMTLPPVHFLDLLTIDRPATRRYNRIRVEQTVAWLRDIGGLAPDFTPAIAAGNRVRAMLGDVLDLRAAGQSTGGEVHRILAAAAIIPSSELETLLPSVIDTFRDRAPKHTTKVVLSGSEIEHPALIDTIEAEGAIVIGEDHGWGADRARRRLDEKSDPLDALANATLEPTAGPFATLEQRARCLSAKIAALAPDRVLHLRAAEDDGAAWEVATLRPAAGHVPFLAAVFPEDAGRIRTFVRDSSASLDAPVQETKNETGPPQPQPRPARSRKSLAVISRFGAYQREWFAGIRAEALAGRPFAVVNANAPQEMLRALGIPFVVNQWWASIAAAKQQGKRYAGLLTANDLPATAEAYSAQGIAAAFDRDETQAPWGGLPQPDILGAVLSTDATSKLFDTWSSVTGAPLQRFQRSVESRWDIPVEWWDRLADDWDHFIEPERLDLFEAELRESIAELERLSGETFDANRFAAVMDLVNEQEQLYRETRDLVARTVPAPISIVDSMPATMVPQWHRGTVWARDAAREFHDEVAARAAAGEAACPGEKLRLMFVGRGVWGDMGFYQRWEESHGAVFVCSMYLSLAADGYIRRHDRGRDPMRALAARFVTMGDELRMPTWAGAWHVEEAKRHGVDGAMALTDADPLVLRALREAGIPVLELGIDNYVPDPVAEADLDRRVIAFLEGPVAAMSAARLA